MVDLNDAKRAGEPVDVDTVANAKYLLSLVLLGTILMGAVALISIRL